MKYSSILNNRIILITGGTGSFGYQMVKELMSYKPSEIRIFSRDEDKQRVMQEEFSPYPISKKMKFVIGDIRDYDRLHAASDGVDIIFHAAALKQVPAVESHPYEAVKTNVFGAYNIVKVAVARKAENVVAISTDKAVKAVNAMGMTKAIQEKIILSDDLSKDGTKFCCVRYGNVLGSRGSVIPVWNSKIEEKKPLPVTHPNMTRFLLTLSDAIDLVFHSLKHGKGGEIFVKKAPAAKMTDLALAYAELKTGKKDYPLEFVGIRAGEKIHEILVSEEEMRHSKEKKDHFVIEKELMFDKLSIKKPSKQFEYSSSSAESMNRKQLIQIMKKLPWTV